MGWCGGQGEECQFAPSPLQLPGEVAGGGGGGKENVSLLPFFSSYLYI